MYTPISTDRVTMRRLMKASRSEVTTMAPKGVNINDAPQFLKLDQGLVIQNYLINSYGRLSKRNGLQRLFDDGSSPGSMMQQFTTDTFIFGAGTTVKAYDETANTITTIHTFTSSSSYEGRRYGDYFFVTNKLEKIGRISRTLTYGTQTGNFTAGKTVTGLSSGATAIILQDADAGATGTLTLGSVVGTFQNGEIITDSATGSATTTSVLTWAYTSITAAPVCQNLAVANNRLIAVSPSDNPSGVAYSAVDDGTNPPFDNWTVGDLSSDADVVYSRNIGNAVSADTLGNNIVVFGTTGKFAFTINTTTVGTDLKKVNTFVIDRRDFGGSRAEALTARGLLYANSMGFWQLDSLGQPNIPFSDQESNLTIPTLGNTYFNDIDLTNADITYDAQLDTAFLTCAKNSQANNLVIAYNFKNKATTTLKGWNIARFMKLNDGEIYGISALMSRAYKCFTGFNDDGNTISTEFTQELPGGLSGQDIFEGFYSQGFLSLSSPLTVTFSIYNQKGDYEADKRVFTWSSNDKVPKGQGWGQSSFGGASFGGNPDTNPEGTVESFGGAHWPIRNFQRLRITISASDRQPHELTWVMLEFRQKSQIRRRNITLNS